MLSAHILIRVFGRTYFEWQHRRISSNEIPAETKAHEPKSALKTRLYFFSMVVVFLVANKRISFARAFFFVRSFVPSFVHSFCSFARSAIGWSQNTDLRLFFAPEGLIKPIGWKMAGVKFEMSTMSRFLWIDIYVYINKILPFKNKDDRIPRWISIILVFPADNCVLILPNWYKNHQNRTIGSNIMSVT